MRPIDADALINEIKKETEKAIEQDDKVGSFWLGYIAGLVIKQPTIQPQSTVGQINDNARSTAQSTDLIDRQAAIDALNEYFARIGKLKRRGLTEGEKAINLDTVGTIKTLPPAQPEHKVRFADKDHVWIDGKQYISLPRFQEAVKEAQPKEGHWIEVAGELECSECHTVFTDLYPDYADSVACPHCGAKMTISK